MTIGVQQITKSAEKSTEVFFRMCVMRWSARVVSRRCRLGRHGVPLKYIVLPLVEGSRESVATVSPTLEDGANKALSPHLPRRALVLFG